MAGFALPQSGGGRTMEHLILQVRFNAQRQGRPTYLQERT